LNKIMLSRVDIEKLSFPIIHRQKDTLLPYIQIY
jgi:hypothetical protein